MTQFFSRNASGHSEKRVVSDGSMPSSKSGSFPSKVKSFFHINSLGSNSSLGGDGTSLSSKSDSAAGRIRQSRFLSGIGRNRSVTVASEGNPLENGVSPTAHANPYFAHQGPPALRHHNDNSVPPSPPSTPGPRKGNGVGGANDQATTAGKEELARKLRRVASAPNAQGLFAAGKSDERPKTADMGKEPLVVDGTDSFAMVTTESPQLVPMSDSAGLPSPGQIRQNAAFRRTYSSNSIKVRNVEVGPGSFDKIKLIGKGDVGKVYLVREKKSSRLYAMKGESWQQLIITTANCPQSSVRRR